MSVVSKLLVFSLIFILIIEISPVASQQGTDTDDYEDNETFSVLTIGGHHLERPTVVKHLVSIRYSHPLRYFGDNHVCGGSIISPRYILTAAHCVSYPSHKLHVIAGTPHRLQWASTSRVLRVTDIVIHPEYDGMSFENDVGILKLRQNIIEDGTSTERIALSSVSPQPGTKCVAIGWGRILPHGPFAGAALHVNLNIWSQDRCEKSFFGWFPGMSCAADSLDHEKDTCSGDSGGPLICNNEVAGITSFGMGCSNKDFAGIYTNVSFYRDWINRNSINSTTSTYLKCSSVNILLGAILIFVIAETRQSCL